MVALNAAFLKRDYTLLSVLCDLADAAIRLQVYLNTDYEQEMERMLSVKQKLEENSQQPSEQMLG